MYRDLTLYVDEDGKAQMCIRDSARAMHEALANDGNAAKYSQNELNAFKSGKYPYYYPNVNWWDAVSYTHL